MICQRCLLRAARRAATSRIPNLFTRTLITSPAQQATPLAAQTTTTSTPRSPPGTPAAMSTSAAQLSSTPLSPSPHPTQPEHTKQAARIQSSVPAGTVLKGLNFIKDKQDPLALEDHEYPAWLWDVLKEKSAAEGGAGDGEDLFSKSTKQRRRAAKALRKQQLLHPEMLAPRIPLYEQSIDLPHGDGTVRGAVQAGTARVELTKAMRDKRRSEIKEANFLKSMR